MAHKLEGPSSKVNSLALVFNWKNPPIWMMLPLIFLGIYKWGFNQGRRVR